MADEKGQRPESSARVAIAGEFLVSMVAQRHYLYVFVLNCGRYAKRVRIAPSAAILFVYERIWPIAA